MSALTCRPQRSANPAAARRPPSPVGISFLQLGPVPTPDQQAVRAVDARICRVCISSPRIEVTADRSRYAVERQIPSSDLGYCALRSSVRGID